MRAGMVRHPDQPQPGRLPDLLRASGPHCPTAGRYPKSRFGGSYEKSGREDLNLRPHGSRTVRSLPLLGHSIRFTKPYADKYENEMSDPGRSRGRNILSLFGRMTSCGLILLPRGLGRCVCPSLSVGGLTIGTHTPRVHGASSGSAVRDRTRSSGQPARADPSSRGGRLRSGVFGAGNRRATSPAKRRRRRWRIDRTFASETGSRSGA